MSELRILIKQNRISWEQVEKYLISQKFSPQTISNIQTVFEKESGVSSSTPYGYNNTNYDNTNIMLNNSIYEAEINNPDNIFQEAKQEEYRKNGTASSNSEKVLMDAIIHITKGVIDYGTGEDIPVHEKPAIQTPQNYNNQNIELSNNEKIYNKQTTTPKNNEVSTNNIIPDSDESAQNPEQLTGETQTNGSNNETHSDGTLYNQSDFESQDLSEQTVSPNYVYNDENPFLPFDSAQYHFDLPQFQFNMNNFHIQHFEYNQSYGYSGFLNDNPNFVKFNINNTYSINSFKNNQFHPNLSFKPIEITPYSSTYYINRNLNPFGNSDIKADTKNIDIKEKKVKPKYEGDLKDRIESLEANGDTFEITNNSDGSVKIHITAGKYLKDTKIKEIYLIYGKDNKLKRHFQVNKNNNGYVITYKNGKRQRIVFDKNTTDEIIDAAMEMQKENNSNINISYQSLLGLYEITETNLSDKNIKMIKTTLFKEPWQVGENKSFKGTANKEDYYSHQNITYADGTEEEVIYKKGKIVSRSFKETDKEKVSKLPKGTKLRTAAKISFKLPDNANEHCKTFANALCNNKQKLMDELEIDNDTYNELAQTAMAIAEKETQMNSNWRLDAKYVVRKVKGKSDDCTWSRGITQFKLSAWYGDDSEEKKRLKKHFEAHGITKPNDLEDVSKAAIATIIALSSLYKELDAQKYKDGVAKAEQLTVTVPGWEMGKDGIAKKTGNTKPWKNNITKQDQLLLLWNLGFGRIILAKGKFIPQTKQIIDGKEYSFMYMNVGRKARLKYRLVEDSDSRKSAEAKEAELLKHDKEYAPYKDMTNSGPMGDVVFMPAMYKNKNIIINSDKEISKLEKVLKDKKINSNLSERLVKALKNQELAFNFGLSENEMKSLTVYDIELLLVHLDNLKKEIRSIKTSDGIDSKEAEQLRTESETISKAEDNFRKEYLTRHSAVYKAKEDNEKVLREFSTYTEKENYLNNGNRRGFTHEKAKGVNVETSNGKISKQNEVLANAAYKVVKKNPGNKSGMCLDGVKNAMRDAGMDVSGMAAFGSSPKAVKNWFDSKVSEGVLVRIEYISVSNDKARVINETDIKTLPAGYFVIFVPGSDKKYSEEKGHAFITNGYGQGYADSTDNLEWRRYGNTKTGSGKGEHGKFYVYKLSDKWIVDETTGKLKLRS